MCCGQRLYVCVLGTEPFPSLSAAPCPVHPRGRCAPSSNDRIGRRDGRKARPLRFWGCGCMTCCDCRSPSKHPFWIRVRRSAARGCERLRACFCVPRSPSPFRPTPGGGEAARAAIPAVCSPDRPLCIHPRPLSVFLLTASRAVPDPRPGAAWACTADRFWRSQTPLPPVLALALNSAEPTPSTPRPGTPAKPETTQQRHTKVPEDYHLIYRPKDIWWCSIPLLLSSFICSLFLGIWDGCITD